MPSRHSHRDPTSADGLNQQAQLIEALCNPALYEEACEPIHVIETHISYVILTGRYAYKIKKAVAFDFLDFTQLASRRYYCEEELRLNRRLAESMYLDVVPITGRIDDPQIGGTGPPLEYAVKMRQFPTDALLTGVLSRGELTREHVDELADRVAAFHQKVAIAPADGRFGTRATILLPARDNFSTLWPLLSGTERNAAASLREWTEHEFALHQASFDHRRAAGFVRECHGDLHLNNIALVDGHIVMFDGLEFNESMRWVDVMSDVAFLVMDLQDRHKSDLASRLLNHYLERTGDYGGLEVLRFYLVYRAMVRAKVVRLRDLQVGDREHHRLAREWQEYFDLAAGYTRPSQPSLVIMHGLSGSGKTTAAGVLVERTGAVRIRTDVERKRAAGLEPDARTHSPVNAGLYESTATDEVYERLCALAERMLKNGYPVIADGTFLKRQHRDLFRTLAQNMGLPFSIVKMETDATTLRDRIARRQEERDASEATVDVLEQQYAALDPLTAEECAFVSNFRP